MNLHINPAEWDRIVKAIARYTGVNHSVVGRRLTDRDVADWVVCVVDVLMLAEVDGAQLARNAGILDQVLHVTSGQP